MLATREVRIARLAAVYAVEAMAERGGRVNGADVCRFADRAVLAINAEPVREASVREDDPTITVSCKFCGIAHEPGLNGCAGHPNFEAGLMSTTDGLLPGRGRDAA